MSSNSIVNPFFNVAGLNMSRVWHCFGNFMHKVDLETVVKMLAASKTNILPVNTHMLSETSGLAGLNIGFGGVQLDHLAKKINLDEMILMLNINHQTSAQAAVNKTKLANSLTGESVIKLEVLNQDMRTSNSTELIKATKQLRDESPELIIFPLIHNDYDSAKTLIELGCPLLRVMGSGIGDGQGIVDPKEFARICALPVPVVLDGGVRDAEDYQHAHKLGAAGCLINSALFTGEVTPEEALSKFLMDSQSVFTQH